MPRMTYAVLERSGVAIYQEDISHRYINHPRPQLLDVAGIDRVRHRTLPVGHVSPRGLEPLACVAAPLDADDRVVLAVPDRHGQSLGLAQVELEALDRGHEPA